MSHNVSKSTPLKSELTKKIYKIEKNPFFSWQFLSILENNYSVSTETINKEDSGM